MAREVATKGIDGIGELVIMAPIKKGFIDAYENVTYESRLRAVAEALFKIECNAREHEPFTPFADVAERILTVFNFRIGVLDRNLARVDPVTHEGGPPTLKVEPQRTMFLIATYDGPFEPYLRLIWKPLGPFLDLLLCNCEGYKLSSETGFPEYIAWVRDHLVDSSIFYTTTSNTLRDQLYLSDLERKQRELDPDAPECKADLELAGLTAKSAQDKADSVWMDHGKPNKDKIGEAVRLAFEALNVLFRLADFYPPNRADARILLKASQDLLLGLDKKVQYILNLPPGPSNGDLDKLQKALGRLGVIKGQYGPMTDHWEWFTQPIPEPKLPIDTIAPPNSEVQRGLLDDYDEAGFHNTHGLTLLFSITDPKKAGQTISELPISWAGQQSLESTWAGKPVKLFWNVAFTASGLSKMKVAPNDLANFPKEFRDGMFKRAPMNGDVVCNHPRRWEFPPRFNPDTSQNDPVRPTIHSEEIDVVLQLRMSLMSKDGADQPDYRDFETCAWKLKQSLSNWDESNLLAEFDELASQGLQQFLPSAIVPPGAAMALETKAVPVSPALKDKLKSADPLAILTLFHMRRKSDPNQDKDPGMQLLAVESTFRPLGPYTGPLPDIPYSNTDHYGFVDGISQPKAALLDPNVKPTSYDDKVPYGDIVYGYRNSRGDTADDQHWTDADRPNNSADLLDNGSFMVIRKIAQYPDRLEALKKKYADKDGKDNQFLAHAIFGRTADGNPLHPDHKHAVNNFTYSDDTQQEFTPFSGHIRLANPRDEFQGRPSPRILRRGMSYGERYVPGSAESAKEPRGVLFIAYNASIADQYEVIQRWLNRGNSTGVSSAANDPLTGVRPKEGTYTFRYRAADGVQRAEIDQPLSRLLWGLYAFMPSSKALQLICEPKSNPDLAKEEAQGQATIDRIMALPAEKQRPEWKRLLEDFFVKDSADLGQAPPVWRAIRNRHRGVLRIEAGLPYGRGAPEAGDVADPPVEEGAARYGIDLASDAGPVVLVADKQLILKVMANSADFSSCERLKRTTASIGKHYVAMDPVSPEYLTESLAANTILYGASNLAQGKIFKGVYDGATLLLNKYKQAFEERKYFKLDFRREFLGNVLGGLFYELFDIPDGQLYPPKEGRIDLGAWGWKPVDQDGDLVPSDGHRKPRCPADFMAPSRFSFFPRPLPAIQEYGIEHGRGLRSAASKLVEERRPSDPLIPGKGFKGEISKIFAQYISSNDLLTRNILGSMTGAIPPLDANMRGILFEWIEQKSLWQHQTEYLKAMAQFKSDPNPLKSHLHYTEKAIGHAVATAMCKRPSPDLAYRTATKDTKINGVEVKKGETVILALVSAMLESLDRDEPDLDPVFGGSRNPLTFKLTHACPARNMAMAIIYAMWAALFDSGRIVAQPASLILQITDWNGPPPVEPVDFQEFEFSDFPPLDLPEFPELD